MAGSSRLSLEEVKVSNDVTLLNGSKVFCIMPEETGNWAEVHTMMRTALAIEGLMNEKTPVIYQGIISLHGFNPFNDTDLPPLTLGKYHFENITILVNGVIVIRAPSSKIKTKIVKTKHVESCEKWRLACWTQKLSSIFDEHAPGLEKANSIYLLISSYAIPRLMPSKKIKKPIDGVDFFSPKPKLPPIRREDKSCVCVIS